MDEEILQNKPLVEAIFELRWKLQKSDDSINPSWEYDPNYSLLIGKLYDELKDKYPYHEKLPAARIPEEISAYLIQHRFRHSKDEWPLVQIGPGIITLNATKKYVWNDFLSQIENLMEKFFNSYPNESNIEFNRIQLRYIDAYKYDYLESDILQFLKDKMRIHYSLPKELFKPEIHKEPLNIDLRQTFQLDNPKGVVNSRFATGMRKHIPHLIWETIVESLVKDVPQNQPDILSWIEKAHNITHNWFFEIINGDLRREFA